ncbi:MAG: hypothetical protein JNK00_08840 [Flavipsychrobacter sp.]|nr:hypothetical protein [Flavipsychrobacter sp.]
MENQYETLMKQKTNEELLKYIHEPEKYMVEAIEAAVAELKERCIPIDETALNIAIERKKQQPTSGGRWKDNITDDPAAPQYYSKLAIYLFSVFFTMLAGTLLLRRNLIIAKEKKASNQVLLFGIAYTITFLTIMIYVSEIVKSTSSLAVAFNGFGAFLLERLFWNKYLGAQIKHRTKPVWKPLLIWIAICAFFILISILGSEPNT